jgi:uncharacterized membrane protein
MARHVGAGQPARPARPRPSLWQPALLAAAAAMLINGVIYVLAVVAGAFPELLLSRAPADVPQMGIEPVLLVSAVGAMAGVAAFGAVRFYAANPVRAFVQLAGAILVLSFVGPFLVPGTTLAQGLLLNLMHVVVAGCVLVAVLRLNAAGEPRAA